MPVEPKIPGFGAVGNFVVGGTSGSILFIDANGNLAQNNAQLFWDNTNNRLGIGTTAPAVSLQIGSSNGSDNQIFVGAVTDPGWGFPAIQMSNTASFYIPTATEGPAISFNVYRTAAGGNNYIATNVASRLFLDSGGNLYFSTAPSGTAGTGMVLTDRFFISNTGNVGIGLTNPAYNLQIRGTTGIRLGYGTTGSVLDITPQATGGTKIVANFLSDVGDINFVRSDSTTSILYLKESNGNVAIGLVPGSFRVRMGFSSATATTPDFDNGLEIMNTNGVANNLASVFFRTENGAKSAAIVSQNNDLAFVPGGPFTERMRITSAGNVGIGTTNPSTLLHVGLAGTTLGTIGVAGNTSGLVTIRPAAVAGTWTFTLPTGGGTNNYALTTDGTGISSWNQISLTAGVTGVLPIANGGTNNSAAYTSGSIIFSNGTSLIQNNSQLFWDNINNRLGIGTTSPVGKLEVAGTSRFGATAGTVRIYDGSGVGFIDTGSTSRLDLSVNGVGGQFVIANGGNVGIGTTSPGASLDTTGTIRTGDGTSATPALSFRSETNKGIYSNEAGTVDISLGGARSFGFRSNIFYLFNDTASIQFGSSQNPILIRDEPDRLAMRRTTNAQGFRLYNTFTDTSNYERLAVQFASNVAEIRSQAAGTGTARNIALMGGNVGIGTTAPSGILDLVTAATNDYPTLSFRQARIATTDATATTLQTIAITASNTYLIEARVVARRTGGTAGTADDGAAYIIKGAYTTKAGVVTLLGALTVDHSAEDVASWDATLVISGTNVLVQVTGQLNVNITWHTTSLVQLVGT